MPVINRLIEQLQIFAQRSDYDQHTPGNGYRYVWARVHFAYLMCAAR
jgi:hypothetical protein